jgi:hypothetical protein
MCPVSLRFASDRLDFIGDDALLSIVRAVFVRDEPPPMDVMCVFPRLLPPAMDDTSVPVMENGVPVPAGVVFSELG